eukprot:g359.t1
MAAPEPVVIDISNTAKESRAAVARCVEELPWTSASARKLDPSADLVWIDRALPVKKFYLQRIANNRRVYQHANRFFGMDEVVTKCALTKAFEAWRALRTAMRFCASLNSEVGDAAPVLVGGGGNASAGFGALPRVKCCLPRSWCLPRDEESFESLSLKDGDDAPSKGAEGKESETVDRWYIAKPDRGRCGRGIGLFASPARLVEEYRKGKLCVVESEGSTSVVVQEYIARPLLFRSTGCKFDLRVYVLIKSLSPTPEAFVFTEGLVRVATTPYMAPNSSNCQTATMHLTNSHINSTVVGHKANEGVDRSKKVLETSEKRNMDDEEESAAAQTKFTITDTLDWLSRERGVSSANIWRAVRSAVSSAISAIYPFAALKHSTCYGPGDTKNERRCFQLLGVDVLLDEDLRPWVLEINNSPSLNLSTQADERIKLPLIKAMLVEVFGREEANQAESRPVFESLSIGGDDKDLVQAQKIVLECFKSLCGHRMGSQRPLKSTLPSRDMYKKLSSAAAAAIPMSTCDGVLNWENAILPSRTECGLFCFTAWIAKLAMASNVGLVDVVAEIQAILSSK